MNLLKFTRYGEWWEYKLVPLLFVGYATVTFNGYPIEKVGLQILFLLGAIVVGAIYVSVINDITDIKEDEIAGKNNRMAKVPPFWRAIILAICILLGFIFGYLIYPDVISLTFYILAYLVFTLYSVPPIRLKKRGFLGPMCDAMGAHFFPSLLITTNLIFFCKSDLDMIWISAIGIWSLSYGLRGILWHQYFDRENDILSNTKTFAVAIMPENFKTQERIILTIEIIALITILSYIFNIWIFLAIISYCVLVFIRKLAFKYKICIIICPVSEPYELLMNDFYLVFAPISLLLAQAINNPYAWLIFCLHLILFHQKLILFLKDFRYFIRMIIRKYPSNS
ncbi:UbiA family prenyltransferase [Pedobacter fastidiosus]|uniref:UbiA family prenyltransferase n=1 Tax=Pedobacter fastidiosus TaxID=2765361 RepID=A0ABR7KVP3_9SPHI|nr:UbiA family prenyltransferase [Pedobacter fastidiosus]MBC6112105.1 UbiA family prenyltransferase [Pedobacter fastidiosus]